MSLSRSGHRHGEEALGDVDDGWGGLPYPDDLLDGCHGLHLGPYTATVVQTAISHGPRLNEDCTFLHCTGSELAIYVSRGDT